MKYSKKKSSTYLPIALSIGVCATSMSVAVAAAPTSAYASEQPAQPASLTAPANKDAMQMGASKKDSAPQKENQIKAVQAPAAPSSKQPSNTKKELLTEAKATKSALNSERSVSSTDTTANATPASTSTPTPEQVKNMPGCVAEYKEENGVKYLVIKPKDGATEGVISADLKPVDFDDIHRKITSDDAAGSTLRFEGNIHGYGDISNLFSLITIRSESIKSLGNIATFDVSNVTNMSNLFKNCVYLTNLNDLKNWNISNVTNMSHMFSGCKNLSNISGLSSWNTGKVQDISYIFSGCKNLESLEGLEKWNTSNVTTMQGMFTGRDEYFASDRISGCEKIANVKALSNWNTKNVTDMSYLFSGCKNLSDISGLSSWDTSNVTTMKRMFSGFSYVSADGDTISSCENLTSLESLSNWNTKNVTDMSFMFSGCKNLKSLKGLEKWNTDKVADMSGMFGWYCSDISKEAPYLITYLSGSQSLNDISALSNWNTSNVTKMAYMFFGCKNLSNISALSNWDTKNVTTMQGMFAGYVGPQDHNPTTVPGCESLKNLDALSKWDTGNVADMSFMFVGCKNLENLAALKKWDTKNVTTMAAMFGGFPNFPGCARLKNVDDIADWDVRKVTNMIGMFFNCKALENLKGFSKWNTNASLEISDMFGSCENLTDISGIQNWLFNTDPAKMSLYRLFAGCKKLSNISAIDNWTKRIKNTESENVMNYAMFGLRKPDFVPLTITHIDWFKPDVFSAIFDSQGGAFIFNIGNTTDKDINETLQNNEILKYFLRNNLVITNNDVLLNTMKGQKADEDDAHLVTVQYGNASEKTYLPAVLDSRINGKGSAPSTDAVEIVKHYIPGTIAEGAGTLRKNNAKVPTDYIAVAEKELTPNAKLSDLFQTYTIKAAHTVTFMDEKSKVTTLKVEAGKNIADLADKTIVTSDAVLTGATMPNAPTKEGYTFKEWNTKADGSGTSFTKDSVVDTDKVVYAQYTKNVVPTPEPMPEPEPIPEPEPTPEPTPTPERTTQIQKTTIIPFTTNYVANTSLAFKQQVIKVYGVNGKVVTTSVYQIDETQPNQLGKLISTHEDITPAVNCLIEVGNKEVIKNDDGSTTIKVYKVDPSTGRLSDPTETSHAHNEPAVLDTQEVEVLPAKMVYVADETLPFNTKKKISDPVDGLKVTTHTGSFVNGVWVPRDEVEITAAKDGLTKVGNKEVIKNDDGSTTIKVYKVDPSTGRLIRVISTYTTMPLTNLKKHMKQTPKTGDEGSWGALLSTLGFSLASFAGVLRARKKHSNK